MKIPKATQLPSGNWNVVVMVGGKRHSVTASTKRLAEQEAAAIKSGAKEAKRQEKALTVGDAIDQYIDLKRPVLSPATIAGYAKIRKNYMQDIMSTDIYKLTPAQIQRSVNRMSSDHAPKTVCNAHGLISAVLKEFRPDFVLRTTLPQKTRREATIPDEREISVILQNSVGTKMELPIMLAMWLGLRASEIRGLTWDCIQGEYLHIRQAIVTGENGNDEVKLTKTSAGDRYIKASAYILDLIARQPKTDEYIIHMSGQAMYKAFSRLCEKWGLPHYRFHDLRHVAASVSLLLGVPNKYSMQRMGHSTDNMLKTTYQHTMRSKADQYADRINEYYMNKLQMKLQTKNSAT